MSCQREDGMEVRRAAGKQQKKSCEGSHLFKFHWADINLREFHRPLEPNLDLETFSPPGSIPPVFLFKLLTFISLRPLAYAFVCNSSGAGKEGSCNWAYQAVGSESLWWFESCFKYSSHPSSALCYPRDLVSGRVVFGNWHPSHYFQFICFLS